jgi:hypothetical protein
MARLIEIQNTDEMPPALMLQVGDVLWFAASGGRVQSGDGDEFDTAVSVEMLGAFLQSVIGTNGQILSPMGAPNVVLFVARSPGQATIEVFTGDPFRQTQPAVLDIIVEL